MIRELRVRNFAIIDELDLEFHPGLNVLTGETGAGKSIIVGALSLLLGRKVGEEVIRSGSDRAEVEAVFEEGGEEIILRREVYSGGKSKAFYQGRGVPVSLLREVGPSLFEIHSQLEHGWILKESNQLEALDRYGGEVIGALLEEYKRLYEEYLREKEELDSLERNEEVIEKRRDELSYYIEEVYKASLREGEEEELIEKRKRLLRSEELKALFRNMLSLIEGESWGGGIRDRVLELKRLIEKAMEYEGDFMRFYDHVVSFANSLGDLISETSRKLELLNLSEESLDEVEGRLSLIRRLKRKHGVDSVEDLLSLVSRWRKELEELGSARDRIYLLRERIKELYGRLEALAFRLSEERNRCAATLEREVKTILNKLAMGDILFRIQIERRDIGPRGADRVRFLMAPSSRDDLRGVGEVASGGEISRLSFALKCAISKNYGVSTLVFDEIDVGIGGEVANLLGEEIKKLSRSRQVICITHLASIASKADHHYFVDKVFEGGRVKSRVRLLSGEERLMEVARMLSGRVSEVALKHAKELLEGER